MALGNIAKRIYLPLAHAERGRAGLRLEGHAYGGQGVTSFTETTPTLENFWRSVILFGRNVASYSSPSASPC